MSVMGLLLGMTAVAVAAKRRRRRGEGVTVATCRREH